jgi:integrase
MPTTRLTKRTIDAVSPGDQPVVLYDTELKGFGIRIAPGGARSWFVEYRPGAGGRAVAKRRMVLGSASALTPDEARKAARAALASVRLGQDPAAARNRARDMPTFSAFVERYLAEEAAIKLKPRTAANYHIYLRKHAAPVLGSLKLDVITTAEVARLHRKIGREHPMTDNRVDEFIGSVYRYAATCGLVPRGTNPAAGVTAFRKKRRERFLSAEELQRLGEALREAETVGIPWTVDETKPTAKHLARAENRHTILSAHTVAAIRLLLFTGCRLREILHLRWSEIDFDRGLLQLPDSKTGARAVVLNAPALAVLDGLPRIGPYVIMGDDPERPRADLNRPWRAVARRARLDGVRLHDLRHSFASYGASDGLGLPIIGKLLGHAQASTTQRYAHLDADPLRRASDLETGRSAAVLEGNGKTWSCDVHGRFPGEWLNRALLGHLGRYLSSASIH